MTGLTTAVANYAKHRKVTVTSREEEDREAKAYALECPVLWKKASPSGVTAPTGRLNCGLSRAKSIASARTRCGGLPDTRCPYPRKDQNARLVLGSSSSRRQKEGMTV
jgi:hypothetical protein